MRLFISPLSTLSADSGITYESIKNCSYSWWCKPISVYAYGYNWLSMVGDVGQQVLYKIAPDGSRTDYVISTTATPKNEHNTAAIWVYPSHIFLLYANHNLGYGYYKIIDHDFNVLKPEAPLMDMTTATSYSQAFDGGGRLWTFSRLNHTEWSVRYCGLDTEGFSGWSTQKVWITKDNSDIQGHLYQTTIVDEHENLSMAFYAHAPTANDNNRCCIVEVNTITGDITNNEVIVDNIFTQTTPIDFSTLLSCYDTVEGSNIGFRLLDNAKDDTNTYLLICTFDDRQSESDFRDGSYYLLVRNNTTFAVDEYYLCDHGKDWFTSYWGGAYFEQGLNGVPTFIIYTSREENEVWYVEKWKFTGSAFTLLEVIDTLPSGTTNGSDGLCLARPQPPLDCTKGGVQLVYQKGDYYENYLDWDNEVILK